MQPDTNIKNAPENRRKRRSLAAGLAAITVTAATLAGAAGVSAQRTAVAASPRQAGGPAAALATAASENARVTDAFGTVERQMPGDKSWKAVNVGDLLAPQTTIRTGDSAACLLRLAGGHVLRIGAKSTVLLRELGKDNQYSFKVLSGQVWSMVRKANHPARYEVETPSAVAGVTGTIFSVSADPTTGETTVSTEEGSVKVHEGGRSQTSLPVVPVTKGMFIHVSGRPMALAHSKVPMDQTHLQAMQQSREMRHMWSLLRTEGILVRAHEAGDLAPQPTFRLQRHIEPALIQDWHSFHGIPSPRAMRGRMMGRRGFAPGMGAPADGARVPLRQPRGAGDIMSPSATDSAADGSAPK